MEYGTATAPAQGEAFVLDVYFNSKSTDPVETPDPKNGLALPKRDWGKGFRAWRREWRAYQPELMPPDPYWSPGLRKLVLGGPKALSSNYFGAQGQVLTINAWDDLGPGANPGTTQVTHLYAQIAAYTLDGAKPTFVEPSILFESYDWGHYDKNQALPFPALGPGQDFVQFSQDDAKPAPILSIGGNDRLFRTGPKSQQHMGVGALISFRFKDQFPLMPPDEIIHLQLATYLSLTPPSGGSVQCFEDPELDVDMGTNQ